MGAVAPDDVRVSNMYFTGHKFTVKWTSFIVAVYITLMVWLTQIGAVTRYYKSTHNCNVIEGTGTDKSGYDTSYVISVWTSMIVNTVLVIILLVLSFWPGAMETHRGRPSVMNTIIMILHAANGAASLLMTCLIFGEDRMHPCVVGETYLGFNLPFFFLITVPVIAYSFNNFLKNITSHHKAEAADVKGQ